MLVWENRMASSVETAPCGEHKLQQDRAFAQAKKRPERLHGPGVE
jgi:hypothetical protein